MEPVHKDIFYPIFTKIRGKQRVEFKAYLNIKNVNNAFSREYISCQRFNQLMDFVKSIDNQDFSSVKEYIESDWPQQMMWLCRLNTHMNSMEYVSDVQNKARIMEHQKVMYSTVHNNKNN